MSGATKETAIQRITYKTVKDIGKPKVFRAGFPLENMRHTMKCTRHIEKKSKIKQYTQPTQKVS